MLVDDDQAVRDSLQWLIESEGMSVQSFASGSQFLESGVLDAVGCAILDIRMPGMSGIEAVRELTRRRSTVQAMMLTVYEDNDSVFEALRAGATGYVLKTTPPDELLDAIRTLVAGGSPMSSGIARRVVEAFHRPPLVPVDETPLTPREHEILDLLVQGHRYREIADQLFISLDTVRTHVRHVYEKMHVRSRAEAAAKVLGRV